MNKMKELATILDELVTCSETLISTTNSLREIFNTEVPTSDDAAEATETSSAEKQPSGTPSTAKGRKKSASEEEAPEPADSQMQPITKKTTNLKSPSPRKRSEASSQPSPAPDILMKSEPCSPNTAQGVKAGGSEGLRGADQGIRLKAGSVRRHLRGLESRGRKPRA